MYTDKNATYRTIRPSRLLQPKALASVIHLLHCVSNTSLCLPHLLGLNELWGLITILLPAENSTEKRFPSSVCIGDKQKTDVHMLSVVITETATLMRLHMWKKTVCIWDMKTCCQPSCRQSLPKILWCVHNANWCACTVWRFYHTCCCTWCVSLVLADRSGL